MSLFTVVKQVMDANGWPAPTTSVASSQDQNMRQCFALANAVLESTSFKKNWPELTREHTFNAGGSYALPVDFHHLCAGSAWNADQYFSMKGSMPPSAWYRAINSGLGDTWFDNFRINMDTKEFTLYPEPAAGEQLVFMYITKNIAKAVDNAPKEAYMLDSDVSLIDEYLVKIGLSWRWRQKKGIDFTAELAEYNSAVRERFAQVLATGEIPVGGKRMDAHITDPEIAWPIGA